MNTKIISFTDLNAWQEGHKLVIEIYKITKQFPKSETYSIVDQMKRASSSVTANIAEGFGRQSYKEKLQFYYMSQGSLTELKNFLLITRDVGYLKREDFDSLIQQANTAHKLLQGLIQKTKTFLHPKS
jgi:four helix bundle protein